MTTPPKPQRRRPWRIALALLAIALLTIRCTAVVTPPRDVADPVTVLIIRDAMHRGLLLPSTTGYVEYGFGDWNWYGNGRDSWYHVFATVLWPTRATLCRRLHSARDQAMLRSQVPWATFEQLEVERARAEALRQQLDEQFAAGSAELVHRSDLRMDFVPCEGSYWLVHNCADACGRWLVQLGCEVSWVPIATHVALAAPAEDI